MNRWSPICFEIKFLAWMLPSALGIAQSPDLPPIPLPAQLIHVITIPTGNSGFSDTLVVTESQYMHLSVFLPSNDYQLILSAPNRSLYAWDPNATAYSCLVQPLQVDTTSPPMGYVYHFTIKAPTDGQWSIQASSPTAVGSDWSVLLNANFVSDLAADVFLTHQKVSVGSPIAASLVVMDQALPVADFQINAKVFRDGDPTFAQSIMFAPVTNPSTGNTTLVAQLPTSSPGKYTLRVIVSGTTPLFERIAVSTFTVYPQGAKLNGTFTQRVDISYP